MKYDMSAIQREGVGKEVGESKNRGYSMTCESRSTAKKAKSSEGERQRSETYNATSNGNVARYWSRKAG